MEKTAIERVRSSERIIGTMVRMVRNPSLASIAKAAGLDFIMLDMEHGSYSLETVEDIARVARLCGLGIFARVPSLDRAYVSRVMDAGVQGVMVPMISSAEEAKKFVGWARYEPIGNRGLSSNGGLTDYQGMRMDAPSFMARQNSMTLAIAQIETKESIDCIDEIAAVDGIDVLLIGPNDLSISLGLPGKILDPLVLEAIEKVAASAEKHNKLFSIHGNDALLALWKDRMQMVMTSLDIEVMTQGFSALAKKYK